MPRTRESHITSTIMRHLAQVPRSWWVKYHGSAYGRAGVPDILGAVRGHMVALEVKAPGRRPRPRQRHEHDAMRAAGATVAVVESWMDTRRVLKKLERLEGDGDAVQ